MPSNRNSKNVPIGGVLLTYFDARHLQATFIAVIVQNFSDIRQPAAEI